MTTRRGGRWTDPAWKLRRQLPLSRATLTKLQRLSKAVSKQVGHQVSPMQVAARLLERELSAVETDIMVSGLVHAIERRTT